MKRARDAHSAELSGKTYWRSLQELADSPSFQQALQREFPEGASELKDGLSRRAFLGLMGASMGLAGLAACRRPEEKILPYSRAPEQVIPGRPEYYATALPFAGTAVGLLVESHDGRPTKVEGNPRHPESLGGTLPWVQAAVLDLYDPDRSAGPREKGQPRTWEEAGAWLEKQGRALRERKGRGLAVLTEGHRSPTLQAALQRLLAVMPQARVFRYEPFDRDAGREGARIAFGRPLEPLLHVDQAQVILALGSDFLLTEGGAIRHSRGFARRRALFGPADSMSRLYAVESAFSLTGANADHRLPLASRDLPGFLLALARELAQVHKLDLGAVRPLLQAARFDRGDPARRFLEAAAADLAAHAGRGLIVAGDGQPAAAHALAHLLNAALGNVGRTLTFVRPFDEAPESARSLAELTRLMQAGEVDCLLLLGGNPAFTAPGDVPFAQALQKVASVVHLSSHVDETSAASTWHLNRAHELESWSDVRAADGTASIVQPLIAPLFGGRTEAEVVQAFLGEPRKAHDLVRQTWREQRPLDFELAWQRALHDGLWEGSACAPEPTFAQPAAVARALSELEPAPEAGLELTFQPDFHAWDGRFANNGWMQELPDPLTKLTWDNAVQVAPATAVKLGLSDGELLEVAVSGRTARLPVIIAPGQAEGSLAIGVGQGRRVCGRVARGVGFDAFGLRASQASRQIQGAQVSRTGVSHALARTQEHAAMEGRPLVREATLAAFQADPGVVHKGVHALPAVSLFPEHPYPGHRWGMVIDLNACTGCNACTVACQAENNIPLVGKEGVLRSREMHWIRVDRYFEGSTVNPRVVFQPISCHHCENAPCEQVCPVGATTHSPEGLNDMAYNRCVGTRYCANNCPYKVRRFNFFNYTKDLPELRKMQHNPDVTVRARGVMEKCTYCVQRIEQARIAAQRAGRDRLKDGEVVAACQQACPTGAITFGDLNDEKSAVARLAALPRSYALLEELNVRPRTRFLAKVRNPNPELEPA